MTHVDAALAMIEKLQHHSIPKTFRACNIDVCNSGQFQRLHSEHIAIRISYIVNSPSILEALCMYFLVNASCLVFPLQYNTHGCEYRHSNLK